MGKLRAPLIRWLRTSPQSCLPRIIKTVLEIPGLAHPDPAALQRVARQLQSRKRWGQAAAGSMEAFLGHWRDSSDIGLVEEVLRLLARIKWRAALQEALDTLQQTRREKSAAAAPTTSHAAAGLGEPPTERGSRGPTDRDPGGARHAGCPDTTPGPTTLLAIPQRPQDASSWMLCWRGCLSATWPQRPTL